MQPNSLPGKDRAGEGGRGKLKELVEAISQLEGIRRSRAQMVRAILVGPGEAMSELEGGW